MKKLVLIIALAFFACENLDNENSTEILDGDYLVLAQGSISRIDLFRGNKLIEESFYAKQNDDEQLSGFAENILIEDKLIFITIQGAYATGDNGKIIVTDNNLKKIYEISNAHPAGHNTMYTKYNKNDSTLIVSYAKGNYPDPDTYKVKKYQLSLNGKNPSHTKILENDLSIQGFGNARFEVNNSKAYFKSGKKIEIYDVNSGALESINTEYKLSDLTVFNNQVYISYKDTTKDGNRNTLGGAYVLTDNSIIDTIKTNSQFIKFSHAENDLFVQTINGSMVNSFTYSDTSHYELKRITISNSVNSFLVEKKLKHLGNSQYRMMYYDKDFNNFVIPGEVVYGTGGKSDLYFVNRTGVFSVATTTKGEYCQVVKIKR